MKAEGIRTKSLFSKGVAMGKTWEFPPSKGLANIEQPFSQNVQMERIYH